MDYTEVMLATAVQQAAVVNRNRALDEELRNKHPDSFDVLISNFNASRPLEAFMVGAYREIMEAKQVVEQLRKAETDAVLSAQDQTPPPKPTTHIVP